MSVLARIALLATLGLAGCHLIFPFEPGGADATSPGADAGHDDAALWEAMPPGDIFHITETHSDGISPAIDSGPADAVIPGDGGQVDVTPSLKITSVPVTKVSMKQNYKYDAEVNTTASVSWSFAATPPAGMSLAGSSGLVSWTTPKVGTYQIHLRVTDGKATDEQKYALTVVIGGMFNGLRPNELSIAVSYAAETRARLVAGPLSGTDLPPTIKRDLVNPGSRHLLTYLASCALASGDLLRVSTPSGVLTFAGELGLAPQWRDGPCDRDCQEWVSACLAARVNASGARLRVRLAGDHQALNEAAPGRHASAEGAFYGNLLAPTPRLFSCRARRGPPHRRGRRCTTGAACRPIETVGICETLCRTSDRHYTSCRGSSRRRYPTITVLLP